MNLVRKVFQNTLWLSAAQLGSRGFGFLIVMVLTRYLGAEEFGRYSFIYAFCGFFGILTDIGIDMIILREASRDLRRAEVLVGNGVFVKALFALTALALATMVAKVAGYPAHKVGLIMLASLSFMASPFTLYGIAFPATLQLQYTAFLDVAGRALLLLFVVLAVAAHGTLAHIILALLAHTVCQTALTVFFARRFFRPTFGVDLAIWRRLLGETWPVALNNLLIMLIMRIDQIMLEGLHSNGDHQLGLYSAAVKYCEVYNLFPMVYFASVFPLLSRVSENRRETFGRLYALSFKYLTLVIVPCALYSSLHASQIAILLFGDAFANAARSIQILIWSEVFVFMAWVLINTMVASGGQRFVLPVTFVVVAANIALNAWLIPDLGAEGASVATLVSYGLALPVSALSHHLRPLAWAFVRGAVRPFVVALILWALLAQLPLGPVACAPVLFAGFLTLMILSGSLDRDDFLLFRRVLARKGEDL
jgi:O-antigen/teichoic acid export membrane protein